MQKISLYLLPNRIKVTTDVAGFTTELRQVYQRKFKIYKGIDNTIEFEVRNGDNRKDNVAGYSLIVKFFDQMRKNVFTIEGTRSGVGLMSATITKDLIEKLDPQMLTVAAFLRSDTEERLLYSDADFNLTITAELANGFNEPDSFVEELTVFNYEFDKKAYTSEIGNFGTIINDDYSTPLTRAMTAELPQDSVYDGIVQAFATKDKSTASSVTWTRIYPNSGNVEWDAALTKTAQYEGDYRFVKFTIAQNRTLGIGTGARFTVTKNNNSYTDVFATLRGQNYLVGDRLTIKGSELGGFDNINDLTVTVTGITNTTNTPGNVSTFIWSGLASNGSEIYESVATDPVTRPPNPVDKIVIRN
jgi:hypothetical protein